MQTWKTSIRLHSCHPPGTVSRFRSPYPCVLSISVLSPTVPLHSPSASASLCTVQGSPHVGLPPFLLLHHLLPTPAYHVLWPSCLKTFRNLLGDIERHGNMLLASITRKIPEQEKSIIQIANRNVRSKTRLCLSTVMRKSWKRCFSG